MPNVRSHMILDEVSLCEQGADQDAYVVLYKSVDAPEGEKTEPVVETINEREATMADMNESLSKALEGIDGAETLSPEIVAALNNAFAAAAVTEVTPESAPAVGNGDVTTTEAPSEVAIVTTEVAPEAAATTEVSTDAPVDFSKSVEFVEMKKALDSATAEAKAATAAAAAANDILAKKQEQTDISEMVAKVRTEAPALTADISELGLALYRVAKSTSTQADADVIVAALSGASLLVAESETFKETGTSVDLTSDSDEMGRLVAKTMQENPGLSRPSAIAKAAGTPEGLRIAGYTN